MTTESNDRDQGVLIPIFSPDGQQIAWSSRRPGGKYALKLADLIVNPTPHLENIRSFSPGGAAYYETGSFTLDGKSLLYASDLDTRQFFRSQIYVLNLSTGASRRLTTGNDYNEHPTYVSTPTGGWVVYMSTRGVERFPHRLMLGTDWYAMPLAGGSAKRLTTMNIKTRGNPENLGDMQVAGTVAMSPSGSFMLGDVQDSLVKQTGLVRTVRFKCE